MQSRIPSWKRIGLQLTGKIADNSLERNAAGSSESKISETGLRHETTSTNKSVVKTVPLQKGRTDGQQGLSDRQIARTRGKASQRKDALVSPDCSDPAGSASGQALGSSRTPASNVAHQSVPSGDEPTNTYEGQSSSPGLGQHTREGPLGAPRDSHGSGKQIEVRVAHRREDEQSKTEQSIHPHQEVLIGDKEDSSSRTHAPSQVASATADSNVNDRIQDGKRKRRSETKLNDPTAPEQKKVVKKMKRDKQRLDGGPEGRGQGNSDHAIDTQTPNHESKRTGQPSSLEASKADKTPVEPQSSNTSEQQRSRHPGNSALGSRKPNKPPSPSSSSPVHLHPALTYLLEFHHHSDTWRFIKSRQAYLLKHFFDLHFIPEIYTPALQSYIVGLKGDHPRGILLKAAAETITMAPHRRAHPRADAHSSSTHGLTEDMIEGKFAKKANEDPHKIDYVQTEEEEAKELAAFRRAARARDTAKDIAYFEQLGGGSSDDDDVVSLTDPLRHRMKLWTAADAYAIARVDDVTKSRRATSKAQDRVRKRAAGKQASIPKAPVRPKQLSGKKRRRDPPSPAEQDPRDDADIPNAASATSTGSDDSGISSHASSEDDKQAQREKGLQKVEEEMQELGRRMEADKLKWERSHKKQDAKMRKLAAKRARLMK